MAVSEHGPTSGSLIDWREPVLLAVGEPTALA